MAGAGAGARTIATVIATQAETNSAGYLNRLKPMIANCCSARICKVTVIKTSSLSSWVGSVSRGQKCDCAELCAGLNHRVPS